MWVVWLNDKDTVYEKEQILWVAIMKHLFALHLVSTHRKQSCTKFAHSVANHATWTILCLLFSSLVALFELKVWIQPFSNKVWYQLHSESSSAFSVAAHGFTERPGPEWGLIFLLILWLIFIECLPLFSRKSLLPEKVCSPCFLYHTCLAVLHRCSAS
jgi:hypothetical protein